VFQGGIFIQGPKIMHNYCLSRQLLNFALVFYDDFRSFKFNNALNKHDNLALQGNFVT